MVDNLTLMTKVELEEHGRGFGIELDRRLTKTKLISQLKQEIKKKVQRKSTSLAAAPAKKAESDSKKYFREVKKVGDRIEVKSHSGRVMDFKDLDSAISWAKDSL